MPEIREWLNFGLNILGVIGVVLVPILLFVMNRMSENRLAAVSGLTKQIHDSETTAIAEAIRVEKSSTERAEDIIERLERIENGILARLTRLEEKVDQHLQWHIRNPGT